MGEHGSEARASAGGVELFIHRGAAAVSIRVSESARGRVARALGIDALPSNNRTIATRFGTVLWVRPDGWLVTGADTSRSAIIAALEESVGGHDGAVVDVSSSRLRLELCGNASRDVLASCCPVDVHPRRFMVGQCAQSVIARAPVLIHLVDETPRWHLYVRPSLADYVIAWLMDGIRVEGRSSLSRALP